MTTDMQAPTEIYVWIVPTKWGDGGSSFIHAWTDDPSRVEGLRDSIGLEPAVYRLASRPGAQADGGNTIDSPYREAWDKGCDIIGALKTKNFLKPQAAEPKGMTDERAEFLTLERREAMALAFEEIARVFREAPPETGLE